jgi:hypothetical protein
MHWIWIQLIVRSSAVARVPLPWHVIRSAGRPNNVFHWDCKHWVSWATVTCLQVAGERRSLLPPGCLSVAKRLQPCEDVATACGRRVAYKQTLVNVLKVSHVACPWLSPTASDNSVHGTALLWIIRRVTQWKVRCLNEIFVVLWPCKSCRSLFTITLVVTQTIPTYTACSRIRDLVTVLKPRLFPRTCSIPESGIYLQLIHLA